MCEWLALCLHIVIHVCLDMHTWVSPLLRCRRRRGCVGVQHTYDGAGARIKWSYAPSTIYTILYASSAINCFYLTLIAKYPIWPINIFTAQLCVLSTFKLLYDHTPAPGGCQLNYQCEMFMSSCMVELETCWRQLQFLKDARKMGWSWLLG